MKRPFIHAAVLGVAALICASAVPARGDSLTAKQIVDKVIKQGTFGWEGAKTELRMVLTDKSGKTQERRMEILGQRVHDRIQTVVHFTAPADVSGMGFLMLQQPGGGSEQYVYLPRLHRTRRITGREREGSFMGSDFSYADLEWHDLKSANHTRLPDSKIGSYPVYVISSVPKPGSDAQYGKLESFIRKSDMIPLRTRFYDKHGKLLKTLYVRRVQNMDGRPVVMESLMKNEQTGHTTQLIVESMEKRTSFPTGTFTPNALQRG